MHGIGPDDPAIANFVEDVEKEILAEAPPGAWHHPRPGDVVTAQIEKSGPDGASESRTWCIGAAAPLILAGVDIDRCVRTMRCGEVSSFRARVVGIDEPATLQLLALERTEDLLDDGRLLRLTVRDGSGWQMPQPGTELRLRFGWRAVEKDKPSPDDQRELDSSKIVLDRAVPNSGVVLASQELGDLQRALLRRYGGHVSVIFEAPSKSSSASCEESKPLLRVEHCGEVLVAGSPAATHLSLTQALASLDSGRDAACRASREVVILVEEGHCSCKEEDWIPGAVGLRVLSDLRTGQRCLVRVHPDLMFLDGQGSQSLGVPPGVALEYDIELLQIMTPMDVSLDKSGRVMKKTTKEGTGAELPSEGTNVTMRIEVREANCGILLQSTELCFPVASGQYCSVIDETPLLMKRGEVCELHCTDPAVCEDKTLCLRAPAGPAGLLIFTLELLDFESLDLYSLEEHDRVIHCVARKKVGAHFFEQGKWNQALRRYQHIASVLTYVSHWKDEAARVEALSMRRVAYLNQAACLLKLEAWREASQACGEVLKEQPDEVKALFRKGQALKELCEFREAEHCFKKVLQLDSQNKEAARMLAKLRQSAKAEVEQQKQMFSKMARGIGATATSNAKASEAKGLEEKAGAALSADRRTSAGTDDSTAQLAVPVRSWFSSGAALPLGMAAVLLCFSLWPMVAKKCRR